MRSVRILRFAEVVRKTGLSRSSIYQRLRAGDFPASVELGPRAVGFVETEVDDYLRRLIKRVRGH
jgi:prophage regulatory protein